MYDFGVPETAEIMNRPMNSADVCPEWERKVAVHVEQLIALGWKWEGRGLVPSAGAATASHSTEPPAGAPR